MKKTWNVLNDVSRRKNKNSNYNDEFNSGSNLMTDKTEISNHFNNVFTNIGPSLARKIQNCNECDFNKFLTCNITNTNFSRSSNRE